MTTSTSSTITAGSYWRSRTTECMVKVIVPFAEGWTWRDASVVVVFRTCENRYGDKMEIRQYYEPVGDFLGNFEPAIWDKEKRTWQ